MHAQHPAKVFVWSRRVIAPQPFKHPCNMARQTRTRTYDEIASHDEAHRHTPSRREGKFGVGGVKSQRASRARKTSEEGRTRPRQTSAASVQHQELPLDRDQISSRSNQSSSSAADDGAQHAWADVDEGEGGPVPKRQKISRDTDFIIEQTENRE